MRTLSSYQDFIQDPHTVEVFHQNQKIFCRDVTACDEFKQLCGAGIKHIYRCRSEHPWVEDETLVFVTEKNSVIHLYRQK